MHSLWEVLIDRDKLSNQETPYIIEFQRYTSDPDVSEVFDEHIFATAYKNREMTKLTNGLVICSVKSGFMDNVFMYKI